MSDATISPEEDGQTAGNEPAAGWSAAITPRPPSEAAAKGQLQPGSVLGDRYEIVQLLGQGGMGAVYKARDRELDRIVALKLIRPEFAKNPEILRRFKQELILARQVTHKNVIRIYDLGQSDAIKFITMDFVEGQDLRHLLLEKGKLPPDQAARILLQICRALEAAHTESVIHRDLKPQNIMLDSGGRAYVMDFGIARSAYLPGMTQTGALIGTPEYMSPEQARGEKLTVQSDLFSLGVIFYELLTGKSPYPGDAPLATLWKRLQEKPKSPVDVDPSVPKPLSDIVMKALEIEPENRWASAREIAQQLEIWLGPSADSMTIFLPAKRTAAYWRWASASLAVLLVVAVVTFRLINPKPKLAHPPVSVLVADFTNHTGDGVFDRTLEPMFNVALEGASFINAYNRGTARKLAQKLPNPSDKLDEQSARLVALSQGVSSVITGEISLRGNAYTVSAMALDAATGKVLAKSEATAANKDEVVGTVPKLAAPFRKALGDTTSEAAQLENARGAFTAASIEVVHQYGLASEQQLAGNFEGARKFFDKAAELDPSFARAYSGMAAMAFNLGQRQLAQDYIKRALEHVDHASERERYRIRGQYYQYAGDSRKSIEDYKELLERYPADLLGRYNLAAAYIEMRDVSNAVAEQRRAVEIAPKRPIMHVQLSFYSSYAGDFQTGEREARQALGLNPSTDGYIALAEAQLGQDQFSQAADTYHQLEKLSATSGSAAASGLADLAVYQGRFSEAAHILERAAAADLEAKNTENAADKFAALGYTQLLRGDNRAALRATEKILANSQSMKARFQAGRNFVSAGELGKAQELAASLGSEITAEPQAYAKIIEGELALKRGDAVNAVRALTDANGLLDTWIGRYELARAYFEAGAFVDADAELDRCIKRRGESLELLMNNVPTYGYFPPVYYLQGRVREGLKSQGFAESYRTYLSIRGQAGEDPLLPEIHKRLGQ
ncbi:MAG TPA: protein kinase [Candidatus Acidoferrum sp.]|nr:protein kinase [Candidatus Acidoferrum sp.]